MPALAMTAPLPDDYGAARRWVALLLAAFLGAILVIDAFSVDYTVDPVVTGSVLGAIVAIIGVDVSKRIGNGGPKR